MIYHARCTSTLSACSTACSRHIQNCTSRHCCMPREILLCALPKMARPPFRIWTLGLPALLPIPPRPHIQKMALQVQCDHEYWFAPPLVYTNQENVRVIFGIFISGNRIFERFVFVKGVFQELCLVFGYESLVSDTDLSHL